MTQREIRHPETLPECERGHRARHIHDLRGPNSGGGHFVECTCRQTLKFPAFDDALRDWRRMNGLTAERVAPRTVPRTVLPFGGGR